MAWSDKLKLKKGLVIALNEAGYTVPKEIQQKTLARIAGGQDLVAVGPEGCGKTTTYILAMLNRFNYAADGVTRAMVLVPDKESVETVIARIDELNRNKTISVVGLYATPAMEAQMDAMADGADIVVATPDRARAIYLKLGLNLNKIELLILDDAELIVKQGLQLPVAELANSIPKCQHLVFTEVLHDKLNRMIAPFMKQPAVVEVEEIGEAQMDTHPQILYHVPNFGTKLNLLRLFMNDAELFTKTVVFVNTRHTAEKLYKSFETRENNSVALLNSWFFDWNSFAEVDDFKQNPNARLLIVVNEELEPISLHGVPFILHLELPADKDTYVGRMVNENLNPDEETMAIIFATDLELGMVRKIEQAIGQKIAVADLPEDLIIERERKKITEEDKSAATKKKADEPVAGEAFHEKKASNSKTYNYSSGEKAKMNKKKKYG
ncbi:DEAD/DEAH box helicase [Mucilaginibacter terrae]|uniref:DEAD/DEAH box helicase n=1 Tax=Mucilaginibacter terrae TaxID=1955052 RepID=UPI00363BD6E6